MSQKVLFITRLLVGGLFIYSGLSKLIQPIEYFQVAIYQFDIAPDALLPVIAWAVPWIELIFGTYLFLGYMTEFSSLALASLALVFQLVLAQALLRRLPVDECGCFGGGLLHLTLYQSFALDTVLTLLLIKLSKLQKTPFSADHLLLR